MLALAARAARHRAASSSSLVRPARRRRRRGHPARPTTTRRHWPSWPGAATSSPSSSSSVPIEALAWLAERVPVRPASAAVAAAQDRLAEKELFAAAGIATAPWAPGRARLRRRHDRQGPPRRLRRPGPGAGRPGGRRRCTLPGLDGDEVISEGVVAFDRELSIVAARGAGRRDGLLPARREPPPRGILARTLAPAPGCYAVAAGCGRRHRRRFLDVARLRRRAGRRALPGRATSCWPTRWRRGSTTPATGRSKVR